MFVREFTEFDGSIAVHKAYTRLPVANSLGGSDFGALSCVDAAIMAPPILIHNVIHSVIHNVNCKHTFDELPNVLPEKKKKFTKSEQVRKTMRTEHGSKKKEHTGADREAPYSATIEKWYV